MLEAALDRNKPLMTRDGRTVTRVRAGKDFIVGKFDDTGVIQEWDGTGRLDTNPANDLVNSELPHSNAGVSVKATMSFVCKRDGGLCDGKDYCGICMATGTCQFIDVGAWPPMPYMIVETAPVHLAQAAVEDDGPAIKGVDSIDGQRPTSADSFTLKFEQPLPAASAVQEFDDAIRCVTDARMPLYGHPLDNFSRITGMQAFLRDCPDTAVRHALDMILVKVARLVQTPDHLDSAIDIAGYARTIAMVLDERKSREKA